MSSDPYNPTLISLTAETAIENHYVISGDISSSVPSNYISFTVPANKIIKSVSCNYLEGDNVIFLAIQTGLVWSAGYELSNMLVYGQITNGELGTNLLQTLTQPIQSPYSLLPGTYTIWINQSGMVDVSYSLSFVLDELPVITPTPTKTLALTPTPTQTTTPTYTQSVTPTTTLNFVLPVTPTPTTSNFVPNPLSNNSVTQQPTIIYDVHERGAISETINGTLGVVGDITSLLNVFTEQGNSVEWSNVYTTVQMLSSEWSYQGTDLKELSSTWQTVYTNVATNSAAWNNAASDSIEYANLHFLSLSGGYVHGEVSIGDGALTLIVDENKVGVNTNDLRESLNVNGNVSITGLVYTSTGDSSNWDSVYTTVKSNSSTKWSGQITSVLHVQKGSNNNIADGSISLPFATIQAASEYAYYNISQDVCVQIRIAPGIYEESVSLYKPNLWLVGASRDSVVVKGNVGVYFNVYQGYPNTDLIFSIENLTIKNNEDVLSVLTLGGTLPYTFILKNANVINLSEYASTLITTFVEFSLAADNGVKLIVDDASLYSEYSVSNCIDVANVFYGRLSRVSVRAYSGHALQVSKSTISIDNCNLSTEQGANVIYVVNGLESQYSDTNLEGNPTIILRDSTISGKTADGNGVYLEQGASVSLSNCILSIKDGLGKAITGEQRCYLFDGSIRFEFNSNCIISEFVTQVQLPQSSTVFAGSLSSNGVIYALDGNSNQWNSVYTTINALSTSWVSKSGDYITGNLSISGIAMVEELVLVSPNGSQWKIAVNNSGELSAVAILLPTPTPTKSPTPTPTITRTPTQTPTTSRTPHPTKTPTTTQTPTNTQTYTATQTPTLTETITQTPTPTETPAQTPTPTPTEANIIGAWNPSEILTNLWLDSSDSLTIAEIGTSVNLWADKSGNGNDLIQGNASKQPQYNSRLINGIQVLDFSVNKYMETFSGFDFGTNFNVFLLCEIDVINNSYDSIISSGLANPRFQLQANSPTTFLASIEQSGVLANYIQFSTTPITGVVLLELEFNYVDHMVSFLLNGEYVGLTEVYVEPPNPANKLIVFADQTKINCMDGALGEIIITNGFLTISDRQKTEGYLAHKWGLTALLPAGHPFKIVAP